MPLLLFLLACSLSRFGMGVLDRAATSWGYRPAEVSADGRDLHYLHNTRPDDQRRAVLLIHGFGGDGIGTWRKQLVPFGADYRVLVPDLLWFGRSAGGAPGLTEQAHAMLTLLDDAHVERADVVGISYGGFVALQMLATAPERVGRLVIVASPGPYYSAEDQAAFLARVGATSTEEVFLPDSPEAVATLLGLTSARPMHIPRPVLRDVQRNLFAHHRDEQRGLLEDLMARRSSPGALPRREGPAPLVVWGALDPIFPVASGQALAHALGARFVVLPNTAHAPIQEQPRVFNAVVLDYLAPQTPARSRRR